MEKYVIEFNGQELQLLGRLIDQAVRAGGLDAARVAVPMTMKIEAAVEAQRVKDNPPEKVEPAKKK